MKKKTCSKCRCEKSVNEFYKDKNTKDGLTYRCKTCLINKQKEYRKTNAGKQSHKLDVKRYRRTKKGKIAQARYNRSNKRKIVERKHGLKHKFGMTLDQYDQMFEQQKGCCVICEKPETNTYKGVVRRLSVDHNHATGRIRRLLCFQCNSKLGILEDERFVRRAKRYLKDNPQ